MEVRPSCIRVDHPSQVAEARRVATALARHCGFSENDTGRVALVVTEAATNLVKHGGGGVIVLGGGACFEPAGRPLELLAMDRGPGMASLDACLVDGYSTAGSPGTGLGALCRVSSCFDCYTHPGAGTVLYVRIAAVGPHGDTRYGLTAGAASVPHPAEQACGDDWGVHQGTDALTLIVSDGLGHGPLAEQAARAATDIAAVRPDTAPAELVAMVHEGLKHTRGAAVAVARIEPAARRVRYCGVGNIAGAIVTDNDTRYLVSHSGTAGREARRIHEFTYDWPLRAVLVLHSDGIGTRWRLQDYPGLRTRHPSVIAGVLCRDFGRSRDDATAVVIRCDGEGR